MDASKRLIESYTSNRGLGDPDEVVEVSPKKKNYHFSTNNVLGIYFCFRTLPVIYLPHPAHTGNDCGYEGVECRTDQGGKFEVRGCHYRGYPRE